GDVLLAGDAVGSTFVVRYAPSGARVWQRSFAAPGAASLSGIATDSAGNAYVTGFFTSTITIGTTTLVSAGGLHDIVLFKLDPAGNPVWARRFGSTGDDTAYAVTVDAGDDVVLAAQY